MAGTQGYLGELYIEDSTSLNNKIFIKIATIQEFTLKIQSSVKEITTLGSLYKNKFYKNFESSFKSWSLSLKKISIESSLGDELLNTLIDNDTIVWIKIIPNKRLASNGFRKVFIGKSFATSQSIKNALTSALDNSFNFIGSGSLFVLSESEDKILQFDLVCIESFIANGCDVTNFGKSWGPAGSGSDFTFANGFILFFSNVGGFIWFPQIPVIKTPATVCWASIATCSVTWTSPGYSGPPALLTRGAGGGGAGVPGFEQNVVDTGHLEAISTGWSTIFPTPLSASENCMLDSNGARFEYHAYMMLVNGAFNHSIDMRIEFYTDAFGVNKTGQVDMIRYQTHSGVTWTDCNLNGKVPPLSRYFRIFYTFNNPNLITYIYAFICESIYGMRFFT